MIMNYCASLLVFETWKINDDPHPVVLCVADTTSALNWTLHMSKKSIIDRALARFFCGLLIGSKVGVNAKWISTTENVIVVLIHFAFTPTLDLIRRPQKNLSKALPIGSRKLTLNNPPSLPATMPTSNRSTRS
jgi:hypothetical protein